MSSYENKRRWNEIGVQTGDVEHSLAPGFGRPHSCSQAQERQTTTAASSGVAATANQPIPQDEIRHEIQNEQMKQEHDSINDLFRHKLSSVWNNVPLRSKKRRTVPLDVVTSINFQTASVEQVRDWAQAIVASGGSENALFSFAFYTTPFEPDFKLFSKKTTANNSLTKKKVSFSRFEYGQSGEARDVPRTNNIISGDFDFSKIVLFGPGKKIDTLTMFPQLIDSCDVPIPLLPCLEENWEKLNLLLWAAYLAKDDFILVKRCGTQLQSGNYYENIALEKTASGHTIVGRKLFLLHAALFELLPDENIKTMEQEYNDTWKKLLQLALNLSPRDDEGLTPLAIAALAQSPISRPCVSRLVIDRMLELDSTTAKRVAEANINNAKRQLPLHLVLQSGKNWDEGVSSIYLAYPGALRMTDSVGRCPIHIAASSLTTPGWVVHKVLQLYPEAAKKRDRYGRLPLHHAVDERATWSAGAESIYVAYPEAAFTPDYSGNLPSYFFPDGYGRHLNTQLEKKVVNECSSHPALISLFFGDFSSKGLVHDSYQDKKVICKRPFDLMRRFTGSGPLSPSHHNLVAIQHEMSQGLNTRIFPELMQLISAPFRQ